MVRPDAMVDSFQNAAALERGRANGGVSRDHPIRI